MSIRNWIIEQLRKEYHRNEDGWTIEALGRHGVKVQRTGKPDAIAYCAEPHAANPFTVSDLQDAATELPQIGMVIVTRRVVDPDVYDRALEINVCVDTFGGFARALWEFDNISHYVHPEETYVRRRMAATRAVTSVVRRGHRAWELQRINGLRPLTIVSHDRYELTDDGFAEVLIQYPKLGIDALVVTNPAAGGFGNRVAKSAHQAGVPLFTLNDFINEIREPWN